MSNYTTFPGPFNTFYASNANSRELVSIAIVSSDLNSSLFEGYNESEWNDLIINEQMAVANPVFGMWPESQSGIGAVGNGFVESTIDQYNFIIPFQDTNHTENSDFWDRVSKQSKFQEWSAIFVFRNLSGFYFKNSNGLIPMDFDVTDSVKGKNIVYNVTTKFIAANQSTLTQLPSSVFNPFAPC